MLIPPSVLMIVWGVLTELSIGKLFLAGVLPGLLLAFGFCAYVVIAALINPALVGGAIVSVRAAPLGAAVAMSPDDEDDQPIGRCCSAPRWCSP